MKDKKKYKVGDKIKLPEEYHQELIKYFMKIKSLKSLIEAHAVEIESTQQDVWNYIREIMPQELKNFLLGYNSHTNELLIKRTLEDWERFTIEKDLWLYKKWKENSESE